METNEDKLRFSVKTVNLNNQTIIELAYLTKETIEAVEGSKLCFEQANCYLSCFHTLRDLLKQVDQEYLAKHERLCDFYRDGRELSNDWDRLNWELPRTKGIETNGEEILSSLPM